MISKHSSFRSALKLLDDLKNFVVLVCCYDTLIPSKTVEQELSHLGKVLSALQTAGFSLKKKKFF